MVRLVDYIVETDEDVQFGTCEICMHTGSLTTGTYVFEDDNKNILEIPAGEWYCGDYDDLYDVYNVPKLAYFIQCLEIDSLELLEKNMYDIHRLYRHLKEIVD